MADIFLSYAREDEARAAIFARVLGELGWSVFWDARIIAGASWDEVVERELQACRCVVVLWSAASIASRVSVLLVKRTRSRSHPKRRRRTACR